MDTLSDKWDWKSRTPGLDGSETDYRWCTRTSQLLSSPVYNLCILGVASVGAYTKRSFGRTNIYPRSIALVVVMEYFM